MRAARFAPELGAALVAAAVALAALSRVRAGFEPAFPLIQDTIPGPFQGQDVAFAAAGLRAAGADLAWVQLLQYAGENLAIPENEARVFDKLKDMTLRVTRLDPRFKRAYAYGSGILAWFTNINRPDEAWAIMQEGLQYNPGDNVLRLYAAALVFKNKGDVPNMLALLETSLDDPGCPSLMKALLANFYKSRGEYDQALRVWMKVLAQGRDDEEFQKRARFEIAKIQARTEGRR